jgi:uncharacterized lipoprotein YehR (DUF1307 family)
MEWEFTVKRELFEDFNPRINPRFGFFRKWRFALWALERQVRRIESLRTLFNKKLQSASSPQPEESLEVEESPKIAREISDRILSPDFDDFDLSGPEDAKEQIGSQLESTQAQYDAIDGTTYELIYEDDYMMERIAVYYDEVDLKDMQGVDGFDSDGNVDADFVSMDKTDQMLQDEGYEKGEEYTVRIFTSHENHVDSTLMFFCDGDRVVMQTTENVIMYDDIDGVSNAQEAEDVIGPQMEDYAAQYDGVDGVVYALTYEEDRVLESIEVNYDEIDMEDVQNIEGFNYEGSKDATYISMKKTLSTLKSQGYKEFTDF